MLVLRLRKPLPRNKEDAMQVITKGRSQKGWSKEFECTGGGNGGGGCGAVLLVSIGDLYHTHSSHYDGSNETYTTFTCPECGVETDIKDRSYPSRRLPDKSAWLRGRLVERPAEAILTTDAVVMIGDHDVALIKRAKEPFADKLCLPGGHVDEGETSVDACVRELAEEVGLTVNAEQLKLLLVLDAEDRDPREGRRVSHVYLVRLPESARSKLRAGSDAAAIHVRGLLTLTPDEIGFDHWAAINCAIKRLR